MDIFNFKCKYCGGEVIGIDGLKSVGKCKYCGSKQTLPKLEDEKRANLFERANHLRRNNEFDKAEALYEQLLNEDLSDPEAYWSLVLCRYGIEYVEDKRSGERLPTVNRMQMTSILGDEDYKSAIANADDEQRRLYEDEAKLINEIQKGILEIARKEEPFDIFICYKETDADGKRSRDSILAQDLYHELTRDGYKVFFARVTLQGKLGSAYEPYIFSALNSAKVMVVLGTKKEHFEAIWVRNEWSRFLGQIKKGERKVLIPAYRDMDAYDLPAEFANLQALDMSRLGFLQELVEGVENILKSYKKKEAPASEPAPAPTPTYTPAPEPPKKKKKGKALPIIIIALILAIGVGAAAIFGSGILNVKPDGESESQTEAPTERPSLPPQETHETEGQDTTPTETETSETIQIYNPAEYTYDERSETVYVNSPSGVTALRSGSSQSICSLYNGDELIRLGISQDENGYWSKVSFNGTEGYIASKYVSTLADPDEGFVTVNKTVVINDKTGALNVRNTPSTDGNVIGYVTAGEEITVVAENTVSGWYKISFSAYSDDLEYGYIKNNAEYFVTEETESESVLETESESASEKPTESETVTEEPTESETVTEEPTESETVTEAPTESEETTESPDETELEVKDPVTVIEEGKAYLGVLAHKNLGKLVYLTGEMDGEYYLAETDNKDLAANVYFEKAPSINYYMYFLHGSTKTYVNVIQDGSYLDLLLSETPETVWHYNATYKCIMTNVGGELVFLGTSDAGTYTNFCAKKVSEGASFFKIQLVISPNQPEVDEEGSLEFELDEATDSYRVVGIGSYKGEDVVIPDSYNGKPVKFIGARAFDKNIQMKSLYIPKTIVFIDEYAFNDCIYLMHITYEGSYEEYLEINTNIYGNDSLRNEGIKVEYEAIESEIARDNYDYSFIWAPDGQSFYVYGIWNLEDTTTLIIPEFHKGIMVTGIADYAFVSRSEITTVFIPWTISVVGENAFAECDGIKSVKFEGTEGDWANITINSGNNLFIKAEMEYEVTADNICDHSSKKVIKEVAPTTDSSGYTEYACDDCGKSWTETLPPLGGGSDDEDSITVYNADDLVALIAQINSGEISNSITIVIGDNIEMEGVEFTPIHEFRGTIDGNGKTISNITLTESGSYQIIYDGNGRAYIETVCVGLISKAYDVTVKDLTIEGMTANINSTGNVFIGALAAYSNRLSVQGCTINSDFTVNVNYSSGTSGVSGLVGYSINTAVTGSNVNTKIRYTADSHEAFAGSLLCIGNLRVGDSDVQMDIVYNSNGGYGHTGYIIGMGDDTGSDAPTTITGSTFAGTCTASDGYAAGVIGQVDYTNQSLVDSIMSNNTVTVNNEDSSGGDDSETPGASDGEVKTVSYAEELIALIEQINSGEVANNVTIELGDDIDMDGLAFTPINDFRGVFDGKEHSISNIVLTGKGTTVTVRDGNNMLYKNTTAVGFIASATDATIKNLTLNNVTMTTTPEGDVFVGSLIGWAKNVNVVDCEVVSNLSVMIGSSDIGGVSGLIGYAETGVTLEGVAVNCTIDCTIKSTESFAGAAVAASCGTLEIDTCTLDVNILFKAEGSGHVGGAMGMQKDTLGCADMYQTTANGTIETDATYYGQMIGEGSFSTNSDNNINVPISIIK